jgi:putative transposase
MLDESGFSLLSPLKRSWSRRGQTPTVRTSLSHHERLNVLGALCVTAGGRSIKLITRAHRRSLRGEEVIAFLSLLLRRFVGPVVLIWDQHPIHQRRLVQIFIERYPRLHVYELPTSAPELNPVEWVWQQVDDVLANTAPRDRHELRANVNRAMARVKRSPRRMRAGFSGAKLSLGAA